MLHRIQIFFLFMLQIYYNKRKSEKLKQVMRAVINRIIEGDLNFGNRQTSDASK